MNTQPKTGVLLINLGTPDAPNTPEVRRYLAEFLSDPRVVDINPIGRWLLLHLIILRFRPAKSAEAYQQVWTEEGSPLLVYGKQLTELIKEELAEFEVELAMRYGNPSIASGLEALKKKSCDRIIVVPLFPQYATSSTGSALAKVYEEAAERWNSPYIVAVPPFYDAEGFLESFRAAGAPVIDEMQPDHVLFSFHGLPVRHMQKSDESGGKHCYVTEGCCDVIGDANRNCYRAQCFATARGIAEKLGLTDDQYTVTFQSRLGRDPWIKPYTDEVVPELAKKGVKKLAVYSPAFVADCLETIEEIGMRAKEDFVAAGGEDLRLIPSLNASPDWASALARLIRDVAPKSSATGD